MSAARRLVLVITIATLTLALSAASVLAQGGAPNPSGGTSLRPTIEDGTGSVALGRFLSSGYTIDLAARGWITNYAASRFTVPTASRPVAGRTLAAAMPRKVWER
jgi:hypothetical protein